MTSRGLARGMLPEYVSSTSKVVGSWPCVVSMDGVYVHEQCCVARQVVAPYFGGFDGLVGHGHCSCGVQSKDLLHHCLCVGQVVDVGLRDGAFLTHHTVNLGLHSLHHVWVADELSNAPLHGVGVGVIATKEQVL